MRWRFPDPNDVAETERRTAVLLGVDRFWQRFTLAAPQLVATFARHAEFDIPGFMEQHLSTVDSRLMWEYGPPLRDGEQRLVITVESERQVRPLLDALLARAPQLPGWEYYAYRMPESWQEAIATVAGRTEIDVSEWRVQATLGELHFLDLKWFLPPGMQAEQLHYAAFVLSEALLGEQAMVTWIGDISLEEHSGARRSAGNAPVSLRARVQALVAQIDERLPSDGQTTTEAGFVYELEPKDEEDYSGRQDLFVATTHALADLWKAAHSNFHFSSRRFSKTGETFCYVKMDGRDDVNHGDLDVRARLQAAIDELLLPSGLGAVTGGGTGRRYSYIDLALRHLDHGLSEVRGALQRAGVPERSWLLFFDAQFADEWIGVYDSTPAPMLSEPEPQDEP